jgi:hypothetical protein
MTGEQSNTARARATLDRDYDPLVTRAWSACSTA